MIRSCCTLFALMSVVFAVEPAQAQFGGFPPQPQLEQPQFVRGGEYSIETDQVLVVMPKSRKIVAGYSIEKGTWDRVSFKEALTPEVHIVVGSNMAAFQTQDSIYAFSPVTGTWDRLQVPKTELSFAIMNNLVKYETQNELYVFSAQTGKWTGTSMETGKDVRLP